MNLRSCCLSGDLVSSVAACPPGPRLPSPLFQMYFTPHFLVSLPDCRDHHTPRGLHPVPRGHCNVSCTCTLLERNGHQRWPGPRQRGKRCPWRELAGSRRGRGAEPHPLGAQDSWPGGEPADGARAAVLDRCIFLIGLHLPLNEAGCPIEFNPSPISVYPFPQNVISPPHYWIPSGPCNWWTEATRREGGGRRGAGNTEITAHRLQKAPSKKPGDMRSSCSKGPSKNMGCNPPTLIFKFPHRLLWLHWGILYDTQLPPSRSNFLRKFSFAWSWHLPPWNWIYKLSPAPLCFINPNRELL